MIWGANYHVAKYLVKFADIYTISFVRFLIASIVLVMIYYCKHRHIMLHLSKKQWSILFCSGFFGIFCYMTLFFFAETLIPANNIAILFAFAPCITVLLSRLFLKLHISLLAYLGIIIALLATIAVISLSDPLCHGKIICVNIGLSIGEVAALGTAVSFAIYSIFNKKAASLGIDSLTITLISTLIGCILLFINYLAFGDPLSMLLHKTWLFWLAMGFISILSTSLSYVWFTDALNKIGVSQTAIFLNGTPLAAVLTGAIFFGQIINMEIAVAGAFIVLGVVLTNYSVNKKNKYKR